MKDRGVLHIKLFKYLLENNNSFGYVQIKDFLLENFEDEENFKDRTKMNNLLKFLNAENYIDIETSKTYGIGIITDAGHRITRNEISSSVRIKPKAVELYNSYLNNKTNKLGMYLSIGIAVIAILISVFPYIQNDSLDSKRIYLLDDKADSLYKEIDNLKFLNNQLNYVLDSVKNNKSKKLEPI